MEFVALGALALYLGFRGYRAQSRTYVVCGLAAALAALYTYHF
jgi:hypothetical protein